LWDAQYQPARNRHNQPNPTHMPIIPAHPARFSTREGV
jgi:hypothetical protein